MPSLITPSAQEIKAIERDVAPLFQRPCRMSRRSSKRLSYRVIALSVQESDQEGHCAAPLGAWEAKLLCHHFERARKCPSGMLRCSSMRLSHHTVVSSGQVRGEVDNHG